MHLVMVLFDKPEEIDSEDIFNALERIAIGLEKKDKFCFFLRAKTYMGVSENSG